MMTCVLTLDIDVDMSDYHEIALHLHSVETLIFTFLLEDIFNTVPQRSFYYICLCTIGKIHLPQWQED